MGFKKYTGSPRDHVAYTGRTKYDCPHCNEQFETESIEIPIVDQREQFQSSIFNLPVLRVAFLEKSSPTDTLQIEIDYVCQKCHLPIKLVRDIEA